MHAQRAEQRSRAALAEAAERAQGERQAARADAAAAAASAEERARREAAAELKQAQGRALAALGQVRGESGRLAAELDMLREQFRAYQALKVQGCPIWQYAGMPSSVVRVLHVSVTY